MFSFHFHGRGNIDVQLHILQTAAIYCSLIFCILEAVNDRQVLYAYGRALFVAVQGSWFYQNAFALYYPYSWPDLKWDLHDHRLIANVTFYFCKHFIFALIGIIMLHLLVQWIVTGSWKGECDGDKKKQLRSARFNYLDEDDTECIKVTEMSSDQEDLLEKNDYSTPRIGENTFSDFVNNKNQSFTKT